MEEAQTTNKKSMYPMIILGILIVLLVLGGGFYLLNKGSKEEKVEKTAVQAPAQNKQKFVDTEDGKNAYKVFPGELNLDAKKALIGFELKTKDLGNGVTEVTFLAKEQEYVTQTLTVKQGESVYFIERFALDDNEKEDTDKGLKDDTAFLVDSQGYLVK